MKKIAEVLKDESAQGANEYILMLAVVLVIVLVAVSYTVKLRDVGGNTVSNRLENIENQYK